MEMGNMIFGNSRGEVAVSRDLTDRFCLLLERLGYDDRGHAEDGKELRADFVVRPYYWDDCECGWADMEYGGEHRDECYQTELRGRVAIYDLETGYKKIHEAAFGFHDSDPFSGFNVKTETDGPVTSMIATPRHDDEMEAWRKAYDKRRKFEERLYKELCAKYKQPSAGCAVHCTCDYPARWDEWFEANKLGAEGHRDDCRIVLPNFEHVPSGFKLKWYKYPLRDSYSNRPLTKAMVDAWLASTYS